MFLMLDELYHVPGKYQPAILDYFHGISRNNNVWLKVGTVKHRSHLLVRNDDGWMGLELPQDAQPINLDASFESFSKTREFLLQVLNAFVTEVGLTINDLSTVTAAQRVIQASGGVARDFLILFASAIEVAQERLAKDPYDSVRRISADDVWDAAAMFNVDRRREFNSDVRINKADRLISTVDEIRDFCFRNELNCILVPDKQNELRALIDEIWDCKLLHTVQTTIMVNGRHHTAYMLDVSEQAAERNMRKIILDLSTPNVDTRLGQKRLIYAQEDRAAA